jgi:hypothetical protein
MDPLEKINKIKEFLFKPMGIALCEISLTKKEASEISLVTDFLGLNGVKFLNWFRSLKGTENDEVKLYLKIEESLVCLAPKKDHKAFYPLRIKLEDSALFNWVFGKLDDENKTIFYKGFDRQDVIKMFELSSRYYRGALTDEQFNAIYREALTFPVKRGDILRGEIVKNTPSDWRFSPNEAQVLVRDGVFDTPSDYVDITLDDIIEQNADYLLSLAKSTKATKRDVASTLRDEILSEGNSNVFKKIFDRQKDLDLSLDF